jgi:hypothetical protein
MIRRLILQTIYSFDFDVSKKRLATYLAREQAEMKYVSHYIFLIFSYYLGKFSTSKIERGFRAQERSEILVAAVWSFQFNEHILELHTTRSLNTRPQMSNQFFFKKRRE